MKWPPRSPDLTPLDFYFWGYVKGKVYVPPLPQTIDELKIRFRAAFQTVTIAVLIKVWANMNRRLQQVIRTKGWHIENMRFESFKCCIERFLLIQNSSFLWHFFEMDRVLRLSRLWKNNWLWKVDIWTNKMTNLGPNNRYSKIGLWIW